MISFQNVTKIYDSDHVILENVSFEIKEGEFVSFVGKSGAGKTTLIKLILGIEEPTFGDVFFNGQNVREMSDGDIQQMRRRIGGVYQDYKLLPTKTVFENVAYIMAIEGKANEEISHEVPKILEVIGLSERTDHFPKQLSGGEQQRLAIARALVNQPDIIIADEPTGNLDPYNTYEVIALFEKIHRTGRTVVLSTHDQEIINRLGKRVITIEDGKIVRDEEVGRFII